MTSALYKHVICVTAGGTPLTLLDRNKTWQAYQLLKEGNIGYVPSLQTPNQYVDTYPLLTNPPRYNGWMLTDDKYVVGDVCLTRCMNDKYGYVHYARSKLFEKHVKLLCGVRCDYIKLEETGVCYILNDPHSINLLATSLCHFTWYRQ